MSDPAATIAAAASRVRKDRAHTTMLIELLVLLVFMAMAFAFVAQDEMAADPLRERVTRLEAQLKGRDQQVSALAEWAKQLEKANLALAAELKRYRGDPKATPIANDQFATLPRLQLKQLAAEKANKTAVADEQSATIARLLAQLRAQNKGGADLPNCAVTPRYLIHVELLGDGNLRVRPAWTDDASGAALSVPGMAALTAGGPVSRQTFLRLAAPVAAWGKRQTVPCGFRATVRETHGNLDLYKRQVSTVEQYFYVARR